MTFNPIPKEYYPLISDYIKILVPSFITYLVTKYTFTRQHRYKIKEKQFNQVYLPLFLLGEQYISSYFNTTEESLCLYIRKVDKLFYKNYQYVYPKTLRLFNRIKKEQKASSIYCFKSQASLDYDFLKKELGYPTNSFFALFHHLNRMEKILYVLFLVSTVFGILLLVYAFIQLLSGDLLNGIFFLTCMAPSLFAAYILRLIIKS